MQRQGIVSRVHVCPVCGDNDCVEDRHCSCCAETSGELSDNAVDEREMVKRGFIGFGDIGRSATYLNTYPNQTLFYHSGLPT